MDLDCSKEVCLYSVRDSTPVPKESNFNCTHLV